MRKAVQALARDLLELYAAREVLPGHALPPDTPWQQELEASFPYVETPDQLAAIAAVKQDMETPRPMDRLVCGDVGYGKTEVAIRAAFKAVMDGKQVAVLVPTTVLAQQHYQTFRERLGGVSRRASRCSRASVGRRAEARSSRSWPPGSVDILIGTHRLLQKDVSFKDLGLVVIDEEQRFGVAHKEHLKQMRARGRRADAVRDADPAHAAHVARRHPRHVDDGDAAGGPPADPDLRLGVRRPARARGDRCASWSAAARSTSSTTASTTSR